MAHLKEISELNKRRTNDMMSAVIKEIGEIGAAVGNNDSVSVKMRMPSLALVLSTKKYDHLLEYVQ